MLYIVVVMPEIAAPWSLSRIQISRSAYSLAQSPGSRQVTSCKLSRLRHGYRDFKLLLVHHAISYCGLGRCQHDDQHACITTITTTTTFLLVVYEHELCHFGGVVPLEPTLSFILFAMLVLDFLVFAVVV